MHEQRPLTSYFLYARKSTEAEDRQVLSIEAQVKELKDVANRTGAKIAEILTESKSAKEPGRPIFNSMMKRLYRGDASGVMCWKLDRLARNPIDGASIIWAMKQHALRIITPVQSYSAEEENTILMYIEFGMAQKYIDDLSKNVKRGVRMKLEKGGWPALAPLGYLNDRFNSTILKDPERFHLIRKMWDLMLTGCHSIEDILDIVNDDWGLRTRKLRRLGGKPLVKSAVYKIFTNPFYVGYMRHKHGFYKGIHEPMVTSEEFDRVQELLGRNDRAKSKKHHFPFAGGLITCGECSCSITAEHKINRFGSHYNYYRCTKKKKGISCSQPCIEDKSLQEQILAFLQQLCIPQSLADWILKHVSSVDAENKLITVDKLATIRKTLEENQEQQEELNRMRYRRLIDDNEFLKEKENLLQERHALESKLESSAKNPPALLPLIEKTIHFAQRAPDLFTKATPEYKRQILQTVGSNLVLRDKTLLIQAQTPFTILDRATLCALGENVRIEPPNFGLVNLKTASLAVPSFSWQAQMNDVRTFWEENLDWVGKFEKVWEVFGDKTMVRSET